jgi:hypothetical protein
MTFKKGTRLRKRNRIRLRSRSKYYIPRSRSKYYISRSRSKSIRSKSMRGGGIPFVGTLKSLIGLTNNHDKTREDLLDSMCNLKGDHQSTGSNIELHNIINQVCELNSNIKESKKNGGIVKSALGLIGKVATLPLRTASSAISNVTGINAGDAVKNMIQNNISPPVPANVSVEDLTKINEKIKSGGALTQEDFKIINTL